MELAYQLVLLAFGLGVAVAASRYTVDYTRALAAALGAPPFIVGVALVSIGTDIPEIANSIVAHLSGEGGINVGDSVGSVLTQSTLVLGLFPFVVRSIDVDRREVGVIGAMTALALVAIAFFVSDGWLDRWEGAVLVLGWVAFIALAYHVLPTAPSGVPPTVRYESRGAQIAIVLGSLAIVAVGAMVAVKSLIAVAEIAGIPKFLIAFFGTSIGTSAPELVVTLMALAKRAPAVALGDALGACLADSTLSIGMGPLVAPAGLRGDLAVVATLYSLAAVLTMTGLVGKRRRLDRTSTIVLLGLYALAYVVVIAAG